MVAATVPHPQPHLSVSNSSLARDVVWLLACLSFIVKLCIGNGIQTLLLGWTVGYVPTTGDGSAPTSPIHAYSRPAAGNNAANESATMSGRHQASASNAWPSTRVSSHSQSHTPTASQLSTHAHTCSMSETPVSTSTVVSPRWLPKPMSVFSRSPTMAAVLRSTPRSATNASSIVAVGFPISTSNGLCAATITSDAPRVPNNTHHADERTTFQLPLRHTWRWSRRRVASSTCRGMWHPCTKCG